MTGEKVSDDVVSTLNMLYIRRPLLEFPRPAHEALVGVLHGVEINQSGIVGLENKLMSVEVLAEFLQPPNYG